MRPRNPLLETKILKTAARLFAKNHYHKVRMDDIAAAAAVGKATLYRYFADKEQLYFGLLERGTNEVLKRVAVAAGRNGTSVRTKLIGVVAAFFGYLFDQPHMGPMIIVNEALFGRESPWQRARDEGSRVVLECFRQAASNGEFKVRDPQFTALLFGGGIRWVYFFGKKADATKLATNLVNLLLDGAVVCDENPRDRQNR